MTTMFQLTPSEVRGAIIDCFGATDGFGEPAPLVPFVTSSPGLGKSAIVKQIAKDYKLKLIDVRLSQCAPEDLMGLPMRIGEGSEMRARFAPFEMFPTVDDKIPAGYDGWLLFLDEFNSASKSVQAAAYKVVLDRMVGQAKLHPDCYCAAAGNLQNDRAIVNSLSTAMQSRLIHYEMIASHKDFMKHAQASGFDYRILGFLEYQPAKLHHFNPDHQDRTFACPRTWEFASRFCKNRATSEIKIHNLAGALSDGIAVELHTFMKEYDKLPSFQRILDEGATLQVPHEASTCYATVTMMLEKTNSQNFTKAVIYVKRFSPEFQVVFFRGFLARNPGMRKNPDFIQNITHLVKFLNEDEVSLAA